MATSWVYAFTLATTCSIVSSASIVQRPHRRAALATIKHAGRSASERSPLHVHRHFPAQGKPTLLDGPVDLRDGRLQRVLDIGSIVEDFETRQKPPFVSIPGQEADSRLTPQQREGVSGIFDSSPEDFRHCMLIHEYAAPLEVIDSLEVSQQCGRIYLPDAGEEDEEEAAEEVDVEKENSSNEDGWGRAKKKKPTVNISGATEGEEAKKARAAKKAGLPEGDSNASFDLDSVLTRPGAVYTELCENSSTHVSTQMFAKLNGVTNPVQIIATGHMAKWSSKVLVPIAGFLCMEDEKSDSAPILHSTPTPCVPTATDEFGNTLDPFLDGFEVFIGSTRLAFTTKEEAEHFCMDLTEKVERDLTTVVWDAEDIKKYLKKHQESHLNEGDICFRFCEDGSEQAIDRRKLCPATAPCMPPEGAEGEGIESCGKLAHTCSSRLFKPPMGAGAPAAAPAGEAGDVDDVAEPARREAVGHPPALAKAEKASKAMEESTSKEPVAPGGLSTDEVEQVAAAALAEAHRVEEGAPESLAQTSARKKKLRGAAVQSEEQPGDLSSAASREALRRRALAEARHRMATSEPDDLPDVLEQGWEPERGVPLLHKEDIVGFVGMEESRNKPGWTTGSKRLLVLIMDWKAGDNSLPPYSHQAPNPIRHYQEKMFPEVERHFAEMSFGKFRLQTTIVPDVIRFGKHRNQMTGRLPFPTLYHEARKALQGHPTHGSRYAFRGFDLVFVICPQVNPIGTKGVAWVGARGAICNGCETISDNFKIMVAVHELGHNLGLSHASSEALEYGNPYDWMGNYPDVVGLHFGLGYMNELDWIPDRNIMEVTDANVDRVNDLVTVTAYDLPQAPRDNQAAGVRISLAANTDDIYLSYDSSVGEGRRGLYVVYQTKDAPHSRLMDAACHSASQQDAHMQLGWTYMDGSHQVVVKVVEQRKHTIKVHIYRAPRDQKSLAAIRARSLFTDGVTKCPVTCQDSDLILSRSCKSLKDKGFCNGQIGLQGKKRKIGLEVCPQTCGMCDEVMRLTTPEMDGTVCADKSVRISGMTCPQIAARDMCGMKTTSGKALGQDLCKKSCGECPQPPPRATGREEDFPDPQPVRLVGGQNEEGPSSRCPAGCQAPSCFAGSPGNGGKAMTGSVCTAHCSARMGESRYCGNGGAYESADSLDCTACGVKKVRSSCPATCVAPTCASGSAGNGGIALQGQACHARCSQPFGRQRYCGRGGVYDSAGSVDCSKCGKATAHIKDADRTKDAEPVNDEDESLALEAVCEDDKFWVDREGHGCDVYKNTLEVWSRKRVCQEYHNGMANMYCRETCGTCKAGEFRRMESSSKRSTQLSDACVDNACIGPWEEKFGRCFQCRDFPKGCTDPETRDVFLAECPMTCGVCQAHEPKPVVAKETNDTCRDTPGGVCSSNHYCANPMFQKACPKTCNLCKPAGVQEDECVDLFSVHTCARYKSYGWCRREDTKDAIRLQCPSTCGVCDAYNKSKGEIQPGERETYFAPRPPINAPKAFAAKHGFAMYFVVIMSVVCTTSLV